MTTVDVSHVCSQLNAASKLLQSEEAMDLANTAAGIKQVTDFGNNDSADRGNFVHSRQNIKRSKERWCAGINRKHYTKRNINESIPDTES